MWVVYLIQNNTSKQKYFGVTKNLEQRLATHNRGGNKYTTKKGTWILIYAEAYRNQEDALKRERRLKVHGSGKLELIKRLGKSLLD